MFLEWLGCDDMQMSVAWGALEEATQADPQDTWAIKAAIRQARPYEELKDYVLGAESLLETLERGQPQSGPSARQDPAAAAPLASSAQAERQAEQAEGQVDQGERQAEQAGSAPDVMGELKGQDHQESPATLPQTIPEAVPGSESLPQGEVELPHTALQAESELQDRRGGEQSDTHPTQDLPAQQEQVPSHTGRDQAEPSIPEPAPTQGSRPAQEEPQAAQLTHPADPSAAELAPTAAPFSDPSSDKSGTGEEPNVVSTHQQLVGDVAPADDQPEATLDAVSAIGALAAWDSQRGVPLDAVTQGAAAKEAVPEAVPAQEAVSSAASSQEAAGEAVAEAATASVQASAPAPAHRPGSMQDFLSFLLPAEHPAAGPGPASSSGAAPQTAPSRVLPPWPQHLVQPQASRRAPKPYSNTSRTPGAPYRPPGSL